MTIKEAKRILREIGVTINKNSHGEYRVNYVGGREETAYYTNDIMDAIGTGQHMVKEDLLSDYKILREDQEEQ